MTTDRTEPACAGSAPRHLRPAAPSVERPPPSSHPVTRGRPCELACSMWNGGSVRVPGGCTGADAQPLQAAELPSAAFLLAAAAQGGLPIRRAPRGPPVAPPVPEPCRHLCQCVRTGGTDVAQETGCASAPQGAGWRYVSGPPGSPSRRPSPRGSVAGPSPVCTAQPLSGILPRPMPPPPQHPAAAPPAERGPSVGSGRCSRDP